MYCITRLFFQLLIFNSNFNSITEFKWNCFYFSSFFFLFFEYAKTKLYSLSVHLCRTQSESIKTIPLIHSFTICISHLYIMNRFAPFFCCVHCLVCWTHVIKVHIMWSHRSYVCAKHHVIQLMQKKKKKL